MTEALLIREITCPHCWEAHTIELDLSGGDQTYIEDCGVCCHPIEIGVHVEGDEVTGLDVQATQ